jgi:hypothetical protein
VLNFNLGVRLPILEAACDKHTTHCRLLELASVERKHGVNSTSHGISLLESSVSSSWWIIPHELVVDDD